MINIFYCVRNLYLNSKQLSLHSTYPRRILYPCGVRLWIVLWSLPHLLFLLITSTATTEYTKPYNNWVGKRSLFWGLWRDGFWNLNFLRKEVSEYRLTIRGLCYLTKLYTSRSELAVKIVDNLSEVLSLKLVVSLLLSLPLATRYPLFLSIP